MKQTEPKWILANHYLSMIYGIYAELGFRAINLNYAGIADVMENFALHRHHRHESQVDPKPVEAAMDKRMASHMAYVIYTRGRKRKDSPELIFGQKARDFIQLHRQLFAEIALVGAKSRDTVDTGARV